MLRLRVAAIARSLALLATLILLAPACGDASAPADKPVFDPDDAVLDTGKADGLSNYWTTLAGELVLDSEVNAEIDWPSWFQGHLITLEVGQVVRFDVDASAAGYVRFYGPSHRTSSAGQPLFKAALVRAKTSQQAGRHIASFEVQAEEAGVYMLVYGPRWVWYADYAVGAACVSGCDVVETGDKCTTDDTCGEGDYCGHNGVVCITWPCDVSFNICKRGESEGAWCDRDRMCGGGLVCRDEACQAAAEDVTVADLLADVEGYDGHTVTLEGTITTLLAYCTKMACWEANPCCNSCGAGQMLFDDAGVTDSTFGVSLATEGQLWGCSGDECSYQDTCTVEAGRYRITGRFTYSDQYSRQIEVESAVPLTD